MTRSLRRPNLAIIFPLLAAFLCNAGLHAQTGGTDTLQEIEILSATRQLTFKTVDDTTKLTIIAGDVRLKQGNTLFFCDSCVINNNTNVFEAWGKVHIKDADTADVYSNHLRYLIKTKYAYLDGNVRLTDGKATLTTPDLEYDSENHIGIYKNGGKVVNRNTTLTSREGWYYTDMKDVYFKRDVLLKDPAYTIVTDSLLYNSETQTTRFISETTITDSTGRIIKTRAGYYNQQTGKAEFGERPTIIDGDTEIRANTITNDDSTGISVAEGNAVVIDQKNKTTLIAGMIFRNKKNEAVLAVRKPLMIVKQEDDSIYISADTLFSGRLTDLYQRRKTDATDSVTNDTLNVGNDSIVSARDSLRMITDSTANSPRDSMLVSGNLPDTSTVTGDTALIRPARDSLRNKDGVAPGVSRVLDRFQNRNRELVSLPAAGDTTGRDTTVGPQRRVKSISELTEKDSTNRYIEAYRNVRIFNDSLQAVCDSMFYSLLDSTFRLYYDPVVWAKEKNQITGDTIHLYTRNKKADHFEAYENSFMVNRLDSQAFNQVKATRMDGYFVDGNIDSVRARGFAESIYYVQDEDSTYTGINESKSDIIDIYFRNKELYKVVFRSGVTGTLWPIKQKSPSEMVLPGFRWLDGRRPKSRLEMYE